MIYFRLLNMDPEPISLQLMDPYCKPVHAFAYTVPRSVEQQLQQIKEIVRLVDIGVKEAKNRKIGEDWIPCRSLFL
jgi:hypothetical protein